MRKFERTLSALLVAVFACSPPADVDLVLLNGNVITVDADDSIVEAVAIAGDRIVAVGSTAEIEALAGPNTDRIDLRGATVTPGLLDAHAHFAGGGVDMLYTLDLSYPIVRSMTDVVNQVMSQVERVQSGEWIVGRGWDEGKLDELRYIYASDLDSISPNNPVWLTHTMGHYGVANSLALERAGVSADTPHPPGGTIDHLPDGRPSGVLKERAQRLVRRLIPEPSPEWVRDGMAALADEFNREGMTGAKDPGITQDTWDAYADVLGAGDLSVRIFALWRSPRSVERAEQLMARIGETTRPYVTTGDDRLISGGIKMYIDGSGGARTAWLYDEWNRQYDETDSGNYGYPVIEPDTLRRLIRLYHDAGLHVSVHSIGDRAIDWVVDSYKEAMDANPRAGLRHGIIHANIPTDHALDVMTELQREYDAGYPEPSATFMWWIGDTYAGNFGHTRASRLNPYRTFLDRGLQWANGSDYTVTPFPARYGLWASVAREPLLGVYGEQPWGTLESVDIHTALKSATIWAAHQMFLDEKIGSIAVGKYADLAVWDRDIYTIPTADIKDMRCILTIFNGDIVYEDPDVPLNP